MAKEAPIKREVTWAEKFGFLGFSASNNVVYNFKSLFYLTFLTMILGIDVKVAGIMLAIGTVWDAVNDPLIALFCANHKFKNGEKVRPYALYFCFPWAVSVVLMFTNFHVNEAAQVAIGLAIYFIFEAIYTFLCMPYNSLAALATHNDEDRKSINAFRSLGGCLGSAIGSVAIIPLVKLFGGLSSGSSKILSSADTWPIFWTAVLMGAICVVGSLFHYFTAKERVKPEEGDKEDRINLIQAYKMLFHCKSWVINMCYIIGYGVTNSLIMQNINYYAAFVKGDSSLATPVLAAYLVVALLTGIFGPKLDHMLGRKKTALLALAVIVVGKIPFVVVPTSMIAIYINSATVGFGATLTFILFNTNRNNIADVLEVQNHRRIDTLVAGGDNLISKLAEAGTIEAMTLILSACGFVSTASTQPAAAVTAIEVFLGWAPMIVTVLMAIPVFFLDIPKELAKSKAKAAIKSK